MKVEKTRDGYYKIIINIEENKNSIFRVSKKLAVDFLGRDSCFIYDIIDSSRDMPLNIIFSKINKFAINNGIEFKLNKLTYNRSKFEDKVLSKLFEYIPYQIDHRFLPSANIEYDISFCGLRIDCKVKNKKFYPVPKNDITVTANCLEREKYCDIFLFGTYDRSSLARENLIYYIIGWISYEDFVSKSYFRPKGVDLKGTGKKTIMEEYVAFARDLNSFETLKNK